MAYEMQNPKTREQREYLNERSLEPDTAHSPLAVWPGSPSRISFFICKTSRIFSSQRG